MTDTMHTELAFSSDGTIYVHFESKPPLGRRVFVGYALTDEERAQHDIRGLLERAGRQTLALGSDGRVYVEEGAIDTEGRDLFRGYATTDEEAKQLFEEFDRTALNMTIAAGLAG
jgi:hypothetical protein